MNLIISVLFFGISAWGLYEALVKLICYIHGETVLGTIIKLDFSVPLGVRRFYMGRRGSFRCDYVLTVSYKDPKGVDRLVKVVARETMRILNGNYVAFFAPKDQICFLHHPWFPRKLLAKTKSANLMNHNLWILIWTACLIISGGMLYFSIKHLF